MLIHQKAVTLGLQHDVAFCKDLINLYFSAHLYDYAKHVFCSVENPSEISLWNCLMVAYTKNFMYTEALDLFEKLLVYPYLKPDFYTYPSVLKACGAKGRIGFRFFFHARLIKTGFITDVVVGSYLLSMSAKCNELECAIQLFDEMPEKDVACWNSVISCYYQIGKFEEALNFFEVIRRCGFAPDSVTITTAISSCARLLDLDKGREIHKELTWN